MPSVPDVVICLANRRWSSWYDRSQHLMSQCAQERHTVFVEEPELDSSGPDVELAETRTGVLTLIPHLPSGLTLEAIQRAQRRALDFVLAQLDCQRPVLWYYTPAALGFTDHLQAGAIVYDCMRPRDGIGRRHQQLLARADVVFMLDSPLGESWADTWRMMWHQVTGAYQRVTTRMPRVTSETAVTNVLRAAPVDAEDAVDSVDAVDAVDAADTAITMPMPRRDAG